MLFVSSLLAVVVALAFQAVGVRLIRLRRTLRVAVGDGGQEVIARARGAQTNLFEYGMLMVALTALAELNGASRPWLGLLALAFVLGRASHLYGLLVAEPARGDVRFRIGGMAITLTVLPLTAATLLVTLVAGN